MLIAQGISPGYKYGNIIKPRQGRHIMSPLPGLKHYAYD
jgi:hypothetical protein